MTGYKGIFKILPWKWYLVDMKDWHKPIVVRKHYDSKQQAKKVRDKYFDKRFEVLEGLKVKEFKIFFLATQSRSKTHKKRGYRHIQNRQPKYDYPENCKTQEQRKYFREMQRSRQRAKSRVPKLRDIDIWNILEDKPILFLTRLKRFKKYQFPYSKGKKRLQGLFRKYPLKKKGCTDKLVKIFIITETLVRYGYNKGPWLSGVVADRIYKLWTKKVDKRLKSTIPQDLLMVKAEFLARGFIPITKTDFNPLKDNYVSSGIMVKPQLVYPQRCWHNTDDQKLYKYYIYDLQANIGIPGHTRAHVAGLDKRK